MGIYGPGILKGRKSKEESKEESKGESKEEKKARRENEAGVIYPDLKTVNPR